MHHSHPHSSVVLKRSLRALLAAAALSLLVALAATPARAAGPPTLGTPVTSAVTSTSVHVTTLVNPQGSDTTWVYELSTDDGSTWTPGPGGSAGNGSSDVDAAEDLTDLQPGQAYRLHLVVTNADGASTSDEVTFTTGTAAPTIAMGVASVSGPSLGRVVATINPNGLATQYHVEWGQTTAYGHRLPVSGETAIAAGTAAVSATRYLTGLSASTTYHARLVATNAEGTTQGTDRSFTTRPPFTRPTSGLPDGRAYEQVSPMDKNSSDALGPPILPAVGNGLVVFGSLGSFGDALSGGPINYLARRGSTGWTNRAVNPPRRFGQTGFANFDPQGNNRTFSDDLSKALFFAASPTMAGAPPNANDYNFNAYLTDTRDGTVTPVVANTVASFNQIDFAGGSKDMSHRLFQDGGGGLTADAPAGAIYNLYESFNGQLRLVGILPDGTVAPGGATSGSAAVATGSTDNVMSADGSRIYFSSPARDLTTSNLPAEIYLREDNGTPAARTVDVSASQRTVADPDAKGVHIYEKASADGSVVYFFSQDKLTDDSTADATLGNGGYDLYRYDVASGELTDITVHAGGADVRGAVAISDDGSRAYFVARGVLAAGATAGAENLYLWENGTTRYITTMASDDSTSWAGIYSGTFFQFARTSRISGDGRHIAFESTQDLTGFPSGGKRQIFVYDAGAEALQCASCPTDGSPPPADTVFSVPDVFTTDGTFVFDTRTQISPRDANTTLDVYEFSGGQAQLISSGQDGGDSTVGGISRDGEDIFFRTYSRLVGQDRDNNADFYDARVGGGFASQNPPPPAEPCHEDACQGPAAGGTPSLPSAGSLATAGRSDGDVQTRPSFTVTKLTARQRATLARDGKVVLKVAVSQAGRVTAAGTTRIGKRTVTVLSGSVTAKRKGTVALSLRLSAAARGQLRRAHRLPVSLSVRFAGVSAARSQAVSLKSSNTKSAHSSARATYEGSSR